MRNNFRLKLNAIAVLTGLTGILTIASTLAAIARTHHVRIVIADAHAAVIAGLSLVYLAALLRKGKHNAWLIALPVYSYLIIRNYKHFVVDFRLDDRFIPTMLNLMLPTLTLVLLIVFRKNFNIRSELLSFGLAVRRVLIVLLVAFIYGIAGFSLMDEKDFHQELSLVSSAHYTIDQFNLTTNKQISPYTKRANVFLDSLGAISLGAIAYSTIALFSPIRFRLRHSQQDYEEIAELLPRYSRTSEDFFKLWPRDKAYFFNGARTAALAYKAAGGTALVVGDPLGPDDKISGLVKEFSDFCWINDWTPAFIHTDGLNLNVYSGLNFDIQKIGEEAIIDTEHFTNQVSSNKYFRHIKNKFEKLGYDCVVLEPPHTVEIIAQLHGISKDWLRVPGRAERGFMMGHFTDAYIQQCRIVAVKNSKGEIEAFVNQVPPHHANEANFDFLRHRRSSPGNINDFLMRSFIITLNQENIKKLNMGLAPLSGLERPDPSQSAMINGFLSFAYANGNRFYSFQGLKRFKEKYEPNWESRYIIYRGGLPGFTKTLNSLMRAMRVHHRPLH